MVTGNEDELVGIAAAGDRAEAEMIQGLLESAGIPSLLRHEGVDGPLLGFGLLNPGGGSRRVMVRAGQSEEARAVLAKTLADNAQALEPQTAVEYLEEKEGGGPRNYGLIGAYMRIFAWSFGLIALAFGVFLLLRLV